ncbi:Mediator complex [Perilla frutescens var. hirtella]|uniref:Mediator of RNA polymerase II transcription subunit 10 n=1 Tax=Perilla frutescens var. hirtella TaxID=608512 RepID=A0AAD4PA00_PERFH|nr:Mediator complex [Perilla frutescens var. hirtella]
MIERSPKETRAAATGGLTQSNDASPEEFSSITAGTVVDHKQNLAQSWTIWRNWWTRVTFRCQRANGGPKVSLIDDGRNPDELTRDVLNDCIVNNQVAKGKTDAFKSLRMHLLEELDEVFPDEIEAYR